MRACCYDLLLPTAEPSCALSAEPSLATCALLCPLLRALLSARVRLQLSPCLHLAHCCAIMCVLLSTRARLLLSIRLRFFLVLSPLTGLRLLPPEQLLSPCLRIVQG